MCCCNKTSFHAAHGSQSEKHQHLKLQILIIQMTDCRSAKSSLFHMHTYHSSSALSIRIFIVISQTLCALICHISARDVCWFMRIVVPSQWSYFISVCSYIWPVYRLAISGASLSNGHVLFSTLTCTYNCIFAINFDGCSLVRHYWLIHPRT